MERASEVAEGAGGFRIRLIDHKGADIYQAPRAKSGNDSLWQTFFERREQKKKRGPCLISILHETTLTYTLNTLNIILTLLWEGFFFIYSLHTKLLSAFVAATELSTVPGAVLEVRFGTSSNEQKTLNQACVVCNSNRPLFEFGGILALNFSFLYTVSISFVCVEDASV